LAPEEHHSDITLDFRDLRCPHLLISAIHALERTQPNQILCILASDLNAPSSIGAWARQSGHTLLDMYQEGENFVFYIRREPVVVPLGADS
jgi:tRNA 2-thiouridine synthesizing protein A